jgi:hypothetical protein
VYVGQNVPVGEFVDVKIVDALGPDLLTAGVDVSLLDEFEAGER